MIATRIISPEEWSACTNRILSVIWVIANVNVVVLEILLRVDVIENISFHKVCNVRYRVHEDSLLELKT